MRMSASASARSSSGFSPSSYLRRRARRRRVVLAVPGAAEPARVLAGAELTVATSYHVALSSLLTATPAVLICENEYYSQKAQGLARDFSLPPALFPDSRLDPGEAASAVWHALVETDGPLRREALAERAREVSRRRQAAELELRGDLRSALGVGSGRGTHERASVAAEDREVLLASFVLAQARITAMGEEIEWFEANRARQEEHTALQDQRFRDLTQTASWRSTAPLRAVKHRLATLGNGRFRRPRS